MGITKVALFFSVGTKVAMFNTELLRPTAFSVILHFSMTTASLLKCTAQSRFLQSDVSSIVVQYQLLKTMKNYPAISNE
jgi:hypothetical protein